MVSNIFDKFDAMETDTPYKMDDYVCDTVHILPLNETRTYFHFGGYMFEVNDLTTYSDLYNHLTQVLDSSANSISEVVEFASTFNIPEAEIKKIENERALKSLDKDSMSRNI